jgi:subtilase family serine protease
MDISTPSNAKYGQHFESHEEMKRMLMPSEETVSSVSAWLKAAGIENFETDADWVTFKTTVGVANELLGTKFSWFVSEESTPRKVLRTLEFQMRLPGTSTSFNRPLVSLLSARTTRLSARSSASSSLLLPTSLLTVMLLSLPSA